MQKRIIAISIALIFSSSIQFCAHAVAAEGIVTDKLAVQKLKANELSLEQLFRAKSYMGKTARQLRFSEDGRYLAYLWNPFNEEGSDLYIYDTQNGKSHRITSPAIMRNVDAPEDWDRFDKKLKQKETDLAERQAKAEAQAAYLRGEKVNLNQWEEAAIDVLKKELAEKKLKDAALKAEKDAEISKEKAASEALKQEKAKTADVSKLDTEASKTTETKKETVANKDKKETEKELWELRDELKKKLNKEKLKANDLYPGVDNLVWAKKSNELIFQYRGDLFRQKMDGSSFERLTKTDKAERIISYSANDSGYLYMDDKRIYQTDFNKSQLRQLNPELIHADDVEKKYAISSTTLSEDKQWMAIAATAGPADPSKAPSGRQVEIMNYSERFATAKKVGREVSDDKRNVPATALYIRRVSDESMRQPNPVFTNDGGDVWFEMSRVSFSKDGTQYTFSTWEREKELLRIYVGQTESNSKPKMVFERRGNVGHEVVDVVAPQFTPDGQQLIAVLDEQAYRQPYRINTSSGEASSILKGDFEAHQIVGFTPDSRFMFVLANRDDFAAMNVFRVELSSGAMTSFGKTADFHRTTAVTENGDKIASVAGQWSTPPELKLIDVQSQKNGQYQQQTLTQSHDPAWNAVHLIQPERFHFTNRHGDQIQAYVFKPNQWSSSDNRPAIVYTYGGPLGDRHIIETDSFQATAYQFGMYMAAKHGYVTVAVDPRGHSNYGRKFSDANWEQVGLPQSEDLEDLVKYMDAKLGVDRKRIGLTGWSFGGFQTQYTMYTRPDLFAAGIAGAGPTEWENYNSWYSGRTIGKVDRNKPNLRRYSLLPLTVGLKKPLMLVHGMQDPNVLFQDTVNVYRALLENGKESLVDLFLDPDGEHGMGGAVKPKAWHKKYETFFLQHLGRNR
ncbi:prolyl oligopeptidase family serine peptidase [Undibacterium sp. LX40W]|uniref:Prolyl oligopeptidase family serine peptidase n=1 Tax=Undibacterium nitidum TaxID=2762298 RepID=A0A923HTJ2_9BURK|nr:MULTISPECIES: prolyl oligopeptidase family serine peptidase [Undibacterium]MBC3883085.1 prolyl oligopeptidase family serine peptidase [Undibacterium nitidum]MBC3893366.1 prolyl oligopeptidase family serine peptidase [Undibacterium sp. LX40W]